ncbi:MAG: cytochrome c oxidase accessory protein CcoG [Leptospiraceae bacterium]|nr:cytochrome c oxidase accessory protein CcoG [Leptospiraceae bacterium]
MIVARKILGQMGRYRAYVRVVLLVVYLVIPWLNWGDRPLILLDIASRRFYFPGAVFWPQESYFLLLILMAMGLALFLFTSLFGRLWCGWACPQTVYTELFDNIGRLVSPRIGKASQKLWEKVLVQLVWFITSLLLTYHFIAYFVGARVMLAELIEFGPGVFSEFTWPFFWVGIAAIFHFDLGIFRHNFCVYVCPYARFQSVMLDRDSVVVAYDSHRGEPRRGKKVAAGSKEEAMVGDCTSCTKCVQVCPTGIDIRQGLQVACINCAHCIDACVEEMARYDKETLVGYSSLRFFEERKKSRFLRPRTFIYATLISVVIGSFGVLLAQRQPAALSVNRDPQINPMIAGDLVRNVYRVDLANMREKTRHMD